jgi:DNA-binding NarL/FixJ family response regulator
MSATDLTRVIIASSQYEERSRLSFTRRQQQIIALIAAGCTHEDAGRRLGISARTARAHSDAIKRKLRVERRAEVPLAYYTATGAAPFGM